MDIPVLFKDIEVKGRKFRLNKMDARTGSWMLFKLSKIIAPIFKDLDAGSIKENKEENKNFMDGINLEELITSIFSLEEKEFRYIQDNCLQIVEEFLPGGLSKVLDKYGNYCVLDIEFDTWLLMDLTIQSLLFNVMGFLEGSPLDSLVKGLNISLPSLKM